MGTQCESGYTSHYTLVTKKKASREICSSKNDFEQIEGLTNFFPVLANEVLNNLKFYFKLLTKFQKEIQGDEIAVFESAHVLPRFVVSYSVHKDKDAVL